MPFDRVKTGDPFQPSAPDWNSMLAAAQAHELRQSPPPGVSMPLGGTPAGVLVRNNAGSDLDRYDVLVLAGPARTPSQNFDTFTELVFNAAPAMSNESKDLTMAVLQEPILAGAVGRAKIDGLTVARLPEDAGSNKLTGVGPVVGDPTRLGPGLSGTAVYASGPLAGDDFGWGVVRLGMWMVQHFRIVGSTKDPIKMRWTYTARMMAGKNGLGWDGWVDSDGPDYDLYNVTESMNGTEFSQFGTGVHGHNIKISNEKALPHGNLELVPIPNGTIVQAHRVITRVQAAEWWFSQPNAVNGNCYGDPF